MPGARPGHKLAPARAIPFDLQRAAINSADAAQPLGEATPGLGGFGSQLTAPASRRTSGSAAAESAQRAAPSVALLETQRWDDASGADASETPRASALAPTQRFQETPPDLPSSVARTTIEPTQVIQETQPWDDTPSAPLSGGAAPSRSTQPAALPAVATGLAPVTAPANTQQEDAGTAQLQPSGTTPSSHARTSGIDETQPSSVMPASEGTQPGWSQPTFTGSPARDAAETLPNSLEALPTSQDPLDTQAPAPAPQPAGSQAVPASESLGPSPKRGPEAVTGTLSDVVQDTPPSALVSSERAVTGSPAAPDASMPASAAGAADASGMHAMASDAQAAAPADEASPCCEAGAPTEPQAQAASDAQPAPEAEFSPPPEASPAKPRRRRRFRSIMSPHQARVGSGSGATGTLASGSGTARPSQLNASQRSIKGPGVDAQPDAAPAAAAAVSPAEAADADGDAASPARLVVPDSGGRFAGSQPTPMSLLGTQPDDAPPDGAGLADETAVEGADELSSPSKAAAEVVEANGSNPADAATPTRDHAGNDGSGGHAGAGAGAELGAAVETGRDGGAKDQPGAHAAGADAGTGSASGAAGGLFADLGGGAGGMPMPNFTQAYGFTQALMSQPMDTADMTVRAHTACHPRRRSSLIASHPVRADCLVPNWASVGSRGHFFLNVTFAAGSVSACVRPSRATHTCGSGSIPSASAGCY